MLSLGFMFCKETRNRERKEPTDYQSTADSAGGVELLWSWKPHQADAPLHTSLHCVTLWFKGKVILQQDIKHLLQLCRNYLKIKRSWWLSQSFTVTWPQPHWTFIEALEDWESQGLSFRQLLGTLSNEPSGPACTHWARVGLSACCD